MLVLRLLLVSAIVAGCVPVPPGPPAAGRDDARSADEVVPPGEPTILPGETSAFIPTGPEDHTLVRARVVSVDIQGKIAVESERGLTEVWVTDATRYHFGDPVEISMIVRTGRVESVEREALGGPGPARRWTESGDHAIVVGSILSVDSRGTIAVESPRGPIRVWATLRGARYRVKDFVEVQTRVRRAPGG